MGQVIAFVSGKGGTGKSALCAALATTLAKAGQKVLAMDLDVGLRNLDTFLGIGQSEALSFLEVCRGDYPLSAAFPHPEFPDLSFLTAPANSVPVPRWDFEKLCRSARSEYDFVLLDCPAGLGDGMTVPARMADRTVVVTLPDPASLRCAERVGQELEKLDCKNVQLVVNRLYNDLLKALGMNIDDMMDAVGLPLLGIVPSDPGFSLAAAKGKAYITFTRSGAVPACQRITKRILGQSVPVVNR